MASTSAAAEGRRRDWWPAGPAVAIVAGIAILALPAGLEGPTLLPISPGHALSLVDAVGVVPLAAGSTWLHAGLWRRRDRLAKWTRQRIGAAAGLTFAAGLGLGLLLASAFSSFYWWWAVGAAMFAIANVAAVWATAMNGTAQAHHDRG
jgi:hypothetical protein